MILSIIYLINLMLSVVYQTNKLFKGSILLTQHIKLVENKQKLVLPLLKLND